MDKRIAWAIRLLVVVIGLTMALATIGCDYGNDSDAYGWNDATATPEPDDRVGLEDGGTAPRPTPVPKPTPTPTPKPTPEAHTHDWEETKTSSIITKTLYYCGYCDFETYYSDELNSHLREGKFPHGGYKKVEVTEDIPRTENFKCNGCDFATDDIDEMEAHDIANRAHDCTTNEYDMPVWKCGGCEYKGPEREFWDHSNADACNIRYATEDGSVPWVDYVCHSCDGFFGSDKDAWLAHEAEYADKDHGGYSDREERNYILYVCLGCDKYSTTEKSEMESHQQNNTVLCKDYGERKKAVKVNETSVTYSCKGCGETLTEEEYKKLSR